MGDVIQLKSNVLEMPNRPSLEQVKKILNSMLSREVGVEQTKFGKYICKYLEYGAPMSTLVGDTEDDAYRKLLHYLNSKPTEEPDEVA
jgi:hypothetical protein